MIIYALFFFFISTAPAADLPQTESSPLDPSVVDFLDKHSSHRLFYDPVLYNHYYQSREHHPTAIVFLPGMGEPALKYYALYKDLDVPARFYFWDHIGQGFSFHYTPLNREKVHITNYEIYIKTLTHFLRQVRKDHKELIVIAHSMGGHIALRVLKENPELIDKLALSAPMIDINTTWVPIHFISWLSHFLPTDSYPPFYFLFKKNSEKGNYTTTSQEKLAIYKKSHTRFPEIKRSGATIGWISASQNSIKELSQSHFQNLQTPVLLLQAEEDYLVSNNAQTDLCKRIPQCQLYLIQKSKHELLFEKDPPRQQSLMLIRDFIFKTENSAKLSPTQNH